MLEIEVKFLDVDPAEIEKRLIKIGGEKVYDDVFEEWIFQKDEWQSFHGRARVRVEKHKIRVAYKETTRKTSEGNVEIEFEVDNKEHALAFINKLGIPLLRHQQKRRIHFTIGEVMVEIDFWPQIPPLIEIEGKNMKAIESVVKKLGLNMKDVCTLDARQIIKDIYKVDIDMMKEYVF